MAYTPVSVSSWPNTMIQHAVAASGLVPRVTGCYTEYLITTTSSYPDQTLDKSSIGPGMISNLRYDPRNSYTGGLHLRYTIDGVEIENDLSVSAYDFVIGWPWDVPDHDDQRIYWMFKHGFKVECWHHIVPDTPAEVRVIWQEIEWI